MTILSKNTTKNIEQLQLLIKIYKNDSTDIINFLTTLTEKYCKDNAPNKCDIYYPFNLLLFANVSYIQLEQIINIINPITPTIQYDNLMNTAYVDYYEMIEHNQYDYIIEIFKIQQKRKNELWFKYIFELQINGSERFILKLFMNISEIALLWNIVKHIDNLRLFTNTHTDTSLLLILIQRYLNNDMQHVIYTIIDEIIQIDPTILTYRNENAFNDIKYHGIYRPFEYIISYTCKIFITFPYDEFNALKKEPIPSGTLRLLELLLKYNNDLINYINEFNETPLLLCIKGKHVQLIEYVLYRKADINYIVYVDDYIISIFRSILLTDNKTIQSLFIKLIPKFDLSIRDTNLNLYCYNIFYNHKHFDIDFKKQVLKYTSNMYIFNRIKQNILHIIFDTFFTDDISNYIDILLKKKLDWSSRDSNGNIPLDIIQNNKKIPIDYIINSLLIPNYLIFLKYRILKKKATKFDISIFEQIKNKEYTLNTLSTIVSSFTKEQCNNIITYLNKTSLYNIVNNEYILQEYKHQNIGYFNTGGTEILYITILSNNNKIKSICNKTNDIDEIYATTERLNTPLYATLQYRLKHYILTNIEWCIEWVDTTLYYIPNNIFKNITSDLKQQKTYIYVIMINKSYVNTNIGHVNVLIIDTIKKIAVRFEPQGIITTNNTDLDKLIINKLNEYKIDCKYYSPLQYIKKPVFQQITFTSDLNVGDPGGYCLAWSYWFVEMYCINHDKIKSLKQFVKVLFNKMFYNYESINSYIRNYAHDLQCRSIELLKSLNIPNNMIYRQVIIQDEYDYELITNKLITFINTTFK